MLRRFFDMIQTTPGGLKQLLAAYLFNRARWKLWLLFGVVLAAYAFNIKLAVLYNDWNGRFFNALQAVDRDAIFRELPISSDLPPSSSCFLSGLDISRIA